MPSILHICSDYHNTRLYGSLFDHLSTVGCSNTVYTPTRHSNTARLSNKSSTIITRDILGTIHRLSLRYKTHLLINDIKNAIGNAKFDLIHAHTLFSDGLPAYYLSRILKIPYVISVRNVDINTFLRLKPYHSFTAKKILDSASSAVFLSPSYRESIKSKVYRTTSAQCKFNVIPNGIAAEFLSDRPLPKQKNINGQLTVLYVGQITKNKNPVATAQACKLLINTGINVKYIIAGQTLDTHLENSLLRFGFVDLRGPQNPGEIIKLMRESDIFCMPSFTETFGIVYAEAMSQGMPVVYTTGQGFDGHFINGHVGLSVNPNDPTDISNAIMQLHKNINAISTHCLAESNKFDWTKIANSMQDEYTTCIEHYKRITTI